MRVICFPVRRPVTELRGRVVLVATWKPASRGIVEFVYLSGSREESSDCSSEGWIAPTPLSLAKIITGRDGRRECLCLLMFKWHTETSECPRELQCNISKFQTF